MRKFIIDTDTASDDAIAILACCQNQEVEILAITTVAGNVSVAQATENAKVVLDLLQVETPLYEGSFKPLDKELVFAHAIHGQDGLGNLNLPKSSRNVADAHAVDAIIELVNRYPDEIELITLGPLTNIALAIQKAPQSMRKLKSIILMAGNGLGPGNVTPYAEFNAFADAKSLQQVLDLNVSKLLIGWDVIRDGSQISGADLAFIKNANTTHGNFMIDCTKVLKQHCAKFGNDGFALGDPTAVLVALHPEIMTSSINTHLSVETDDNKYYGHLSVDNFKSTNATLCTKIDNHLFKQHLFAYLGIH